MNHKLGEFMQDRRKLNDDVHKILTDNFKLSTGLYFYTLKSSNYEIKKVFDRFIVTDRLTGKESYSQTLSDALLMCRNTVL